MSAMTAIPAIGRALRAHPHPGYAVLLKTKAKPHFDRTVTDRSNPLFGLVLTPNHIVSLFSPCSLPTAAAAG